MGEELRIGDLVVAPDVMDTIVRIAAEKVEGVASVGVPTDLSSVISFFSAKKPLTTPAIGVRSEDGDVRVAVHVTALFGFGFQTLAQDVRASVAADLRSQLGIEVGSVDVFIDALVFPKE